MNLPLVTKKAEARVDSRLVAQHLGNQHKAVMALIERYAAELKDLGVLPFEMEKPKSAVGGRPERFVLLNEDQAYLLLNLSRNTQIVVALKLKLVKAFSAARKAAELRAEYQPSYRCMHDRVHALAEGSSNKNFVHANLNRLINSVVGIGPGHRDHLDLPHMALTITAQYIATAAWQSASNHRDGYAKVKDALVSLAALSNQLDFLS